jgi:HlyD family secretion protein
MRILKTLIAVLIAGLIVVSAVGCQNAAATPTATASRQVKVTMGTISNAVTGTATLGLAKTQDLAFETAGTVDVILVEAGNPVTKNQELVKLDTSAHDTQLESLQKTLNTAQRNLNTRQNSLTSAQRNLVTKQTALTKAQQVDTSNALTIQQKQINLLSAQAALDNIDEVKAPQATVDAIKNDIKLAESNLRTANAAEDTFLAKQWKEQIVYLNESLVAAQNTLTKVLKGVGVSSTNVSLQITQAVFAVEQAKKAVVDAQTAEQTAIADAQTAITNAQYAVDDAKTAVANAQLDVDDAKAAVLDAQDSITTANSLSLVIKAPFDGFVTAINVKGGDEILKGKVALQVADPNQFSASFMVSETDIFSIKVGQAAVVSVDALSSQSFPAKVTAIAPLATVNSGVVNYKVTAELTSLVPVGAGRARTSAASGSLPAGLTPPAGFTPPAGATPPAGFTPPAGLTPGAGRPGPTGANSSSSPATLKQGLSASVTITIQEKQNVLIVPIRAVTTQAGKSTVQLMEGTLTKPVEVTTGLSDATNIEIMSGLTDGQIVVVKASGSAGSSGFGPGGGIRIP